MTYYVNKTDGTAIVVLDGTKDITSTSLTLLGKLSSNYGENQNENFVRILENFAYSSSPANPITGQIWYNTTEKVLKVYNAADSAWTTIGQKITGNTSITGNLIVGGAGVELQEVNGSFKLINQSTNGNISIVANVGGTYSQVLNIEGATGLITVAGNATNNLGITTKSYVDSHVNNLTSNAATQSTSIQSLSTNISSLQANINSINSNINSINSNVNSLNSGTTSLNAKDISLNGNVVLDNSGTGNVYVNLKTPGGVSILTAEGSVDTATPVTIKGQWLLGTNASINALYADLAENFASDQDYEPGTVLVFGGSAEVTESTEENDIKVAGVVTTDPAFVMNQELTGTKSCIALQGRVPCKVIGPIKLGDMLTTSSVTGHAQKATDPVLGSIIGKALQNYEFNEPGVIEILAGRM